MRRTSAFAVSVELLSRSRRDAVRFAGYPTTTTGSSRAPYRGTTGAISSLDVESRLEWFETSNLVRIAERMADDPRLPSR